MQSYLKIITRGLHLTVLHLDFSESICPFRNRAELAFKRALKECLKLTHVMKIHEMKSVLLLNALND